MLEDQAMPPEAAAPAWSVYPGAAAVAAVVVPIPNFVMVVQQFPARFTYWLKIAFFSTLQTFAPFDPSRFTWH
jgi:hypothetical protein